MAFARRLLPFVLVGMASAWMAFANTSMGDFKIDAGPAIRALAQGDLSGYFHTPAMMGPFATLLEAPFAAIGSGSQLTEYQWACFPCLLAVGLLGLYLAAVVGARGGSPLTQFVVATLCLVNPLTVEALRNGHPEELLTAALAVGAVAVAAQGHRTRAAILLGLAVASKQWAVVAILPVLMALPDRRIRVGLGATAIACALTLPGLLVAPETFFEVQTNASSTWRIVDPWNVWYPTATVTSRTLDVGSSHLTTQIHEAPALVSQFSHPLIVLLAFGVPLALALRRGSFGLTGADAMALLALIALLRCALDPVGNLYYHVPVLLALFGWDAMAGRRLPVAGLIGAAVAAFFWQWSHRLSDPEMLNLAYIVLVGGGGLVIAALLFWRPGLGSKASLSPRRPIPLSRGSTNGDKRWTSV